MRLLNIGGTMYYSKSKKKWLHEHEMNHVHLLNAYRAGVAMLDEHDGLRAEIIDRMAPHHAQVTYKRKDI
jgi:hypothetical protein